MAALGLWFVVLAFRVFHERDEGREPAARTLFKVSILYLFALFAALMAEHIVGIGAFVPLAQ